MFMQLTIQLIHYHVLICIIICYKPKGNIIILLSPLELKSYFISIEAPWSGVNCHHFISYERPSLQVKKQLIAYPILKLLFIRMAAALMFIVWQNFFYIWEYWKFSES